jgi:hypothetical protein
LILEMLYRVCTLCAALLGALGWWRRCAWYWRPFERLFGQTWFAMYGMYLDGSWGCLWWVSCLDIIRFTTLDAETYVNDPAEAETLFTNTHVLIYPLFVEWSFCSVISMLTRLNAIERPSRSKCCSACGTVRLEGCSQLFLPWV